MFEREKFLIMEGRIERMNGKLSASREMIAQRLKSAKGRELEVLSSRMDIIDSALSWQPLPTSSGFGVVGESTRRMSRGQRP